MKTTISLLIACLLLPAVAAAAPLKIPALKICVGPGGVMAAKQKCKAGEVAANFAHFIQPQESPVKGCRTVIEIGDDSLNTSGTTGVSLYCNTNEYLMTHGFATNPPRLVVPRRADIEIDQEVAFGVIYVVQGEINSNEYGENYSLIVSGVCCPK
jgi:hypothetical protein